MTFKPAIYDWRVNCAPIDQVFRAGPLQTPGGVTLGGYLASNPEPGGRAELVMEFQNFATKEANLDASWTISRAMAGAVWRVRLYKNVQLVDAADLVGSDVDNGIPWSNGEPWANGENWAFAPTAAVASSAAKGAISFTADFGALGQVLNIGHVIGFYINGYNFAHKVMDISYSAANIATVEVMPPLRRTITATDYMLFRPSMLAVVQNPADLMGNFRSGRSMTFGTARFLEALV